MVSELSPELSRAAAEFDLPRIADLFMERLCRHDLTDHRSLFEAHTAFPEFVHIKKGYNGKGWMAFRALARDEKRIMVLIGLYDCAGPPHLHHDGEDVIDLVGDLQEHSWCVGRSPIRPAGGRYRGNRWGVNTFHQPFTNEGRLWIGVCTRPAGATAFEQLTKEQLRLIFEMHYPEAAVDRGEFRWNRMNTELAMDLVKSRLELMMPPKQDQTTVPLP